MNSIKKIWADIKTDPKTVREFGLILTVFLVAVLPLIANAIGIAFFGKEFHYSIKWPVAAAIVFLIHLFSPRVMAFTYKIAMFVAFQIGWVMMRILMPVLYYLMITPVALVIRVSGKDVLDEKIDRTASSYWKRRHPKPPRVQYEKMY